MRDVLIIAKLELLHIFGSKRYIFIAFFSLLPCLLSIAIKGDFKLYEHSSYQDGHYYYERSSYVLGVGFFLYLTYLQFVCLLLAVLYGTSLIQREIDQKTINYLFTRPISKRVVYTGKYLGAVIGLSLLTGTSLVLTWVISFSASGLSILFTFLISIILCYTAYIALFSIIGILFPGRALSIGIMYGFTIELVFSLMPANVNRLSIEYYLRSFIWNNVPKDKSIVDFVAQNRDLASIIGNIGVAESLIIIIAISAILSTAALTIFTHKENNIAEKV